MSSIAPQNDHSDSAKALSKQVGTLVELFRKALLEAHADDWTMETISEAAHICAKACYEEQANYNLAFQRHDRVIAELLDGHSRDMAVLGKQHGGYSTTAMTQTEKLTKRLTRYLTEVRTAAQERPNTDTKGSQNAPNDAPKKEGTL